MRFLMAICILFLSFGLFSSSTFSATQPACAPYNPPAVSGPLTPLPPISHTVLINEVLTTPNSPWSCTQPDYANKYPAWIELYNPQNQAFDLYAARIYFDTGPGTTHFPLPFGASIAPHGFLVLFPTIDTFFNHAQTTRLRLMAVPDAVIDEVEVPPLGSDQSYARVSDGASNWYISAHPTIGTTNNPVTPPSKATPVHHGHDSSTTQKRARHVRQQHHNGSHQASDKADPPIKQRRVLVNGFQPQWSAMPLPDVSTPVATSSPEPAMSWSPPPPSDDTNLPHRLLLTMLVIALASVLYWCWRLFSSL